MLKLITEKIRNIIKNHVSPKNKIIEIHWKNKCFWWFRRLHVRMIKVSKKHQKWDQNPSTIQWKIYKKTMPKTTCETWCWNHRKWMPNTSKTGPNIKKNQKKGITKIDAKIDAKKGRFINPPSPAGSPPATGISPQPPPYCRAAGCYAAAPDKRSVLGKPKHFP